MLKRIDGMDGIIMDPARSRGDDVDAVRAPLIAPVYEVDYRGEVIGSISSEVHEAAHAIMVNGIEVPLMGRSATYTARRADGSVIGTYRHRGDAAEAVITEHAPGASVDIDDLLVA